MIGLGIGITTIEEFNRRFVVAVRGITFLPDSWDKRFAGDMVSKILGGLEPTEKQQQAIYNLAHKFRRQITDESLRDYAAAHAKGAD